MDMRNLLLSFSLVACCITSANAMIHDGVLDEQQNALDGDGDAEVRPLAQGRGPVLKVGALIALGGLVALGAKKFIDYGERCNVDLSSNGLDCTKNPDQSRCRMGRDCFNFLGAKALLDDGYATALAASSNSAQRLGVWLAYQKDLLKLRTVYLAHFTKNLVVG